MTARRPGRVLVLVATFAATVLTASSPDPWARVPPLPTSCYQTSDDFDENLEAARVAIVSDLDRQTRINHELSEKVGTIDPMELASRQQQYMMEHPQEAMAMMQRSYDLGQSSAEVENNEKVMKLLQELEEIDVRYHTALDSRVGPFEAKFKDLDTRAQKDLVVVGESLAYAPWAVQEHNTLIQQESAAYETVCAEWWATSGPFHAWLKRYKDQMVNEQIPHRQEADEAGAGYMVIMLSTPETSYESTATLDAINQYIGEVGKVFARRRVATTRLME